MRGSFLLWVRVSLARFTSSPAGSVFVQFVLLGFLTTLLTSGADLLVVFAAGPLSRVLQRRPRLGPAQRIASGGTLVGLGVYVAARDT